METSEQVKWNPNPEGKGGFQDHPELINPGGRPKNSLKSYVAKKLAEMSEEEKDEFLKTISRSEQWRMGEGNPAQDNTHKVDGRLVLEISKEAATKYDVPHSDTENSGD